MMLFVVITVLFMVFWGYLLFIDGYYRHRTIAGKLIYNRTYIGIYTLLVIIVVFITLLRFWWFGGPDTHNYVLYFQGIKDSYYYVIHPIHDVAFVLVTKLCQFISKDEQVIIAILTLFTLFPILFCINRFSGDKVLSIIFFVCCTTRIWLTSMAAERQFFSISALILAIWAYRLESKKGIVMFYALLLLSCLFHMSTVAAVMLLLLVLYIPIKNRILYFTLFFTWLLTGFHEAYDTILNLFDITFSYLDSGLANIAGYVNDEIYTSTNMLSALPINLFAFISLYFSNAQDKNQVLIKYFVVGVCLYNLLSSHPIGVRMVHVFFVVGCIAIPHLTNISDRKYYLYISYVIMAIFAWRMIVSYLSTDKFYYLDNPWYEYSFFFM